MADAGDRDIAKDVNMEPPKKKLKSKIGATPKSTEAEFNTMEHKNVYKHTQEEEAKPAALKNKIEPADCFEDLTPEEQEITVLAMKLKKLSPRIHQHRIYIKEKLARGVTELDKAASCLNEINKPDYLDLLKQLHLKDGWIHYSHIQDSLMEIAIYRVLTVIETTRLPVVSAHKICTAAIEDYYEYDESIRPNRVAQKEFKQEKLCVLWKEAIQARIEREILGLVKAKLRQALQASEEAWTEVLEDVKLADPAVGTAVGTWGGVGALNFSVKHLTPAFMNKSFHVFDENRLKLDRALLAEISTDYIAPRQELETLCG